MDTIRRVECVKCGQEIGTLKFPKPKTDEEWTKILSEYFCSFCHELKHP